MRYTIVIGTLLLFGTVLLGQDSVIELSKKEALDLIVARDQVEEAARLYEQRQEEFNQLLSKVFAEHGVEVGKYGWIPTTGQLVPIKVNENKTDATTSDSVESE